jgi:hypothetical protein
MACVLISGCSAEENGLDAGMELRSKLIKADTVSFCVDISADHGNALDLFSLECSSDREGTVSFRVAAPDSISGITGQISGKSGALTFDETVLYFPLVAQERLSPVSAPQVLINALKSGYLRASGIEENQIRLTIDDSYENDALQVDIWLDEEKLPRRAEVLCEGRMILSLDVSNFEIL